MKKVEKLEKHNEEKPRIHDSRYNRKEECVEMEDRLQKLDKDTYNKKLSHGQELKSLEDSLRLQIEDRKKQQAISEEILYTEEYKKASLELPAPVEIDVSAERAKIKEL